MRLSNSHIARPQSRGTGMGLSWGSGLMLTYYCYPYCTFSRSPSSVVRELAWQERLPLLLFGERPDVSNRRNAGNIWR